MAQTSPKALGGRIKNALGKRSQRELAKKLQVDKNTISNWVTGKSTPDALRLVEIAQFTGRPVGYFLDLGPEFSSPPASEEVNILRGQLELLRQLYAEERRHSDEALIQRVTEVCNQHFDALKQILKR